MRARSTERLSTFVGWLLLLVPSVALLGLMAWLSTYKLGIVGGLSYAAGLGVLTALLLWRWRRS